MGDNDKINYIKQGIYVSKETWLDFDQAVIDYKRSHLDDSKKTTLINNSFKAFLDAHKRLWNVGRVDTLEFIQEATSCFALAMERYANFKGISASEVNLEDVAKWLSNLIIQQGELSQE